MTGLDNTIFEEDELGHLSAPIVGSGRSIAADVRCSHRAYAVSVNCVVCTKSGTVAGYHITNIANLGVIRIVQGISSGSVPMY